MTTGSKCASFGTTYARVYDALYRDKNYAAESRFVLDQLSKALPHTPRHILDLGCGTGLHDLQMAQAGISITGIDRSAEMIAFAKKYRETLSPDSRDRLQFGIGDIRSVDLRCRYDAVVSLFHVISYVVEEPDLKATFQNVRRHLIPGGVFLFDFWYGPAVMRKPPQTRVKMTQVGESCIKRTTLPEWDPLRRRVYVNYEIEINNSGSGEVVRDQEQHLIRYFFPDELRDCLDSCGFEVVSFGEVLTGGPPSDTTFSVYALSRLR